MRYELRQLQTGWCVWDIQENAPAVIRGGWQINLSYDDAQEFREELNRLEGGKPFEE